MWRQLVFDLSTPLTRVRSYQITTHLSVLDQITRLSVERLQFSETLHCHIGLCAAGWVLVYAYFQCRDTTCHIGNVKHGHSDADTRCRDTCTWHRGKHGHYQIYICGLHLNYTTTDNYLTTRWLLDHSMTRLFAPVSLPIYRSVSQSSGQCGRNDTSLWCPSVAVRRSLW